MSKLECMYKELETVQGLRFVSFDIMEQAEDYILREIEAEKLNQAAAADLLNGGEIYAKRETGANAHKR